MTELALRPTPDDFMTDVYNRALEYLDEGFSIFPISLQTRKPLNSWAEFQDRPPSYDEVEDWFQHGAPTSSGERVRYFNLGIVTGAVSGLVVLDADSAVAMDACVMAGLDKTPRRVRTARGVHYYFAHPKDGTRCANKIGSAAAHDPSWPHVSGVDLRGDGGFVVAPPSLKVTAAGEVAHVYEDVGETRDMWDVPVWSGWPDMAAPEPPAPPPVPDELSELDLSLITPASGGQDQVTLARAACEELGGKIPTGLGNGRNQRVTCHAGELIAKGVIGAELQARVEEFMDRFFEDRLPVEEYMATLRSVSEADKRNHPERYLAPPKPEGGLVPFTDSDIDATLMACAQTRYLIDPWLPAASIAQIYGFSGHGKSWLTLMMLWHLARGEDFGPYSITHPLKVAYFDFENGARTIATRFKQLRESFGSSFERLQVIAPALHSEHAELNLHTEEGLAQLKAWLTVTQPDVVVLDTVRSAWPGLAENKAEDWANINQLCLKLRNAGVAVIVLHHANKPQEGSSAGAEAGSTNQLTVLETQLKITQAYEDDTVAKAKRGVALEVGTVTVMRTNHAEDPSHHFLAAFQLSYGKVREHTDNHVDRTIFLFQREDGTIYPVCERSPKQRARVMAADGQTSDAIARALHVPKLVIEDWLHR